jgi:phosphoribosyl 1,2-cyclic phosphodiesterase/ActR/RegA family two-component response regulator
MPKKRILIADSSLQLAQRLLQSSFAELYEIETALSGEECEEKLNKSTYDLLLVDLFLPGKHGIEILKKIRSSPKTKSMGVIVTSLQPLCQNYNAAIKEGADYFLQKPFDTEVLFELIERFFSGTLEPAPFPGVTSLMTQENLFYLPKPHCPDSYIKFWGTRGSIPVSGSEYVRFGGNTICAEICYGKDRIIIDSGTGIRPLGSHLLNTSSKEFHLFLGHTHWDHITGFPFFYPIYDPEATVHIWAPVGFEKSTKELFTDIFAYAFFPVRLDEIKANLLFHDLRINGPVSIGNIQVEVAYAFHPGATFCFKITVGNKSFGYVTDNEMLMGYHGNPKDLAKGNPYLSPYRSLIDFFQNCQFLVHEAQYSPIEYRTKVGWGHSSISNAAVLIREAGIKEWIITHHDPMHTDLDLLKKDQLQLDILEDGQIPCTTRMAYDGFLIPL